MNIKQAVAELGVVPSTSIASSTMALLPVSS
jgi:hypothetical protein